LQASVSLDARCPRNPTERVERAQAISDAPLPVCDHRRGACRGGRAGVSGRRRERVDGRKRCRGASGRHHLADREGGSAANAFKASLSSSQRATVQYSFNSPAKEKGWSNLPIALVARNGVRVADLDAVQLAKLKKLQLGQGADFTLDYWFE
jgi:Protein of unknown function (DUF3500)